MKADPCVFVRTYISKSLQVRNIFFCHCCLFLFKINRIEMQQKKKKKFVEFRSALSFLTARKKSCLSFIFKFGATCCALDAVRDVQPTAAEMPFAQIGASMRQRRRNGVKLVPGGG